MLKKLVVKGFKSFANRTELVFGKGFNCIIGPNGSGKCITGDSLVHLEDGSLVKIGDLVEEKLKTNFVNKIDDGFVASSDDTKILYLDLKDLKIKSKNILSYVKRESPDTLMKIKTRSGRSITSTKYHPLFILKDNKVVPIKAEDLKLGTRIAVPREIKNKNKNKTFVELLDLIKYSDNVYIPYDKKYIQILNEKRKGTWKQFAQNLGVSYYVLKGLLDKQAINFEHFVKILRKLNFNDYEIMDLIKVVKSKKDGKCNMVWENSPEFARFLGYLIAEGSLPSKSPSQIWFPNSCEEMIEDYKNIAEKLFGLKTSVNEYVNYRYDALIYSQVLRKLLNKFGMPCATTEYKELTNLFLTHSSNEELSAFLNGLYSGDGYVGDSIIELTTKSKKLVFAIENILLRLGITFSSSYKVKVATNNGFSGIYRVISIYGVENFRKFNDNIKLVHPKKMAKLEMILDKKSNPNVDLIEVNSLVKDISKELKLNIKDLKKQYPKLDAYVYNQCLPSRNGLNELTQQLFMKQEIKNENLQQLNIITNSDIFWDEVEELEEMQTKEKWVYDLCVEGDHNFLANNIIVHNTNISDAVCFVLGKSSAHEMRAEKSANLIFNGGKKGTPAKEAEVTIEFDNSSGKFPIQNKEVKITRIVKVNGTSIYKINDEVRTRQQILDLLNGAKIDPDGHNIVLQGDIVSLAEMKPNDRRQVIEEIAGISMYEEKKQKCLGELQKVDGKLNEAEIILTERETNLRELKKDRDQAIKYKELQESLKDFKATLIHLQIKEKTEKFDEIEKRKKDIINKIESINKEIQGLQSQIQTNKEEISKISNEVEVKGEKDQLVIRKEIEELKIVILKASSRLEVCQSEVSKIKNRKDQLNSNIGEVEEKIRDLKLKRQNNEQKIRQVNIEEKETNKQIYSFKEKHGVDVDINNSLEDIDKTIDKIFLDINKLNDEKQNIIRNNDQITFKLGSIDEKLQELKGNDKSLEDLKNKKKVVKEIAEKLSKSINEDSSYSLQLNRLRQEISRNTDELAKQRSRQIGIQERSLGDLAIRKILDLKSTIKGIHGTVSSLGTVENKYSLALEVTAGPRLNSIVVDSDITAQKCIEHLKSNKLGIATFLPLNKIKARPLELSIKSILNEKGVKGLALDIVQYEPKYKDVFSYSLGSTVIIDNMEVGSRIGIGKVRMVTLEGDLMEPSGAMIGGYRTQKTGLGFKEKETNENVERLEEEMQKQRELLDHIETKKTSNESIIYSLREERANLEADIIKLEKTLNIDSNTNIIDSRKELSDEQKKYEKELICLETSIKELNKYLENNKIKKQKIKEKLADPNIAKDLDKLEEARLKIKENILDINAEIKTINTQIESMLLPEREKTEKIIKQQDKELEDFLKELDSVKEIIKNREQELKSKEQEEKKFYSNFKDMINKRNKLNEKIQHIETEIIRETEKSKGNEQKLNNLNIDRAKIIAEMEGLQKEFEPFQDAKIKRGIQIDELKLKIREDERTLNNIGNVNLRALEVYEQIQQEYEKVLDKVSMLKCEKDDVLRMMTEVESKKKEIFMRTYTAIIKTFKEIFSQLTTKGEVLINLENEENPFEAGIDIQVRVIGNKFLDIRSLSGGEKTMAALAFIFAIQEYSPSPFYLLDEVDAALDKRNSELLSKLIEKYANKAQYLVISHNDSVITEAEYIYGVSMQDNVSKVVSLKF